jgi:hypothetical protein
VPVKSRVCRDQAARVRRERFAEASREHRTAPVKIRVDPRRARHISGKPIFPASSCRLRFLPRTDTLGLPYQRHRSDENFPQRVALLLDDATGEARLPLGDGASHLAFNRLSVEARGVDGFVCRDRRHEFRATRLALRQRLEQRRQ